MCLVVQGCRRRQASGRVWNVGFKEEHGYREEQGPTGHYLAGSREPLKQARDMVRQKLRSLFSSQLEEGSQLHERGGREASSEAPAVAKSETTKVCTRDRSGEKGPGTRRDHWRGRA